MTSTFPQHLQHLGIGHLISEPFKGTIHDLFVLLLHEVYSRSFRFANIEIKSVKFEDSLFENCYFEDVKSTNTFFENCTIKNTVFYNTGMVQNY